MSVFESPQFLHFRHCMVCTNRKFQDVTSGERINYSHEKWGTTVQQFYLNRLEEVRKLAPSKNKLTLFYVALAFVVVLLAWQWPVWNLIADDAAKGGYRGVLEVGAQATKQDIKAAYRRLARKWHPDHNPTCGAPCREKMLEIQEAYETLSKEEDHLVEDSTREVFTFIMATMSGNVSQMSYHSVSFICAFVPLGVYVVVALTLVIDTALSAYVYYLSGSFVLAITLGINIVRNLQNMTDPRKALSKSSDKKEYLLFVVIPLLASTVAYHFVWEPYPRWSTLLLKLVLGFIYITGFIAEYRTSFWHNQWAMEVRVASKSYGVRMIIGLLLKDMFAYFIGVPGPYRATMLAMIAGFVYQYLHFPFSLVGDDDSGLIWDDKQISNAASSTAAATQSNTTSTVSASSSCANWVSRGNRKTRYRNPLDSSDDEVEFAPGTVFTRAGPGAPLRPVYNPAGSTGAG
eukprot:PhF_6_TR12924/c0_g1_i2/m.20391